VDPLWPKPMPNNWLLGQTIGLTVDDRDHVWIIHRGNDPGNLDRTEYATPTAGQGRVSECCDPAPPVLEFDAEGNLVGHWGGPGTGYEWPESNHGIAVDHKGYVWIGGNGQPDAQVLKFTRDGKFVAQFGKSKARLDPKSPAEKPAFIGNSNDMENFGRVAKIFIDPKANEAYLADGYLNKRVAVVDMDSGKIKRYWGAYGNKPEDVNLGRYNPDAPPAQHFRNPVHCAELSNDGLVYVCDRPNDPDLHEGRKVREGSVHRETDAVGRLGVGHRLLQGPAAEVPVPRRRRQRARLRDRSAVDADAHPVRAGRAAAGDVPRRAQHCRGFQGQHLHDGNLHGEAAAEVRQPGHAPGAAEAGRAVAAHDLDRIREVIFR
jgi:hypothetical protein